MAPVPIIMGVLGVHNRGRSRMGVNRHLFLAGLLFTTEGVPARVMMVVKYWKFGRESGEYGIRNNAGVASVEQGQTRGVKCHLTSE
jgi:hypothetical protein